MLRTILGICLVCYGARAASSFAANAPDDVAGEAPDASRSESLDAIADRIGPKKSSDESPGMVAQVTGSVKKYTQGVCNFVKTNTKLLYAGAAVVASGVLYMGYRFFLGGSKSQSHSLKLSPNLGCPE